MKMNLPEPKLEMVNLAGLEKAPGHARQEPGNTKELENSIRKNGIMTQPVIARSEDGTDSQAMVHL